MSKSRELAAEHFFCPSSCDISSQLDKMTRRSKRKPEFPGRFRNGPHGKPSFREGPWGPAIDGPEAGGTAVF